MVLDALLPDLTDAAPGTLPCWKAPRGAELRHILATAVWCLLEGLSTVTLKPMSSSSERVAVLE